MNDGPARRSPLLPIATGLAALGALAAACATTTGPSPSTASAEQPCVGSRAPREWKHVVVLFYENRSYDQVIGTADAPFITSLAQRCGSAYSGQPGAEPTNNWHDADYRVDGTLERRYNSKPSYATYTSGVSPAVHGIVNDEYEATSDADNIFNQLRQAGKSVKVYYDGPPSETPCAKANFSGAYHDPLRYFTNVGAQSADPSTFCNTHDVPLVHFGADVATDQLPAFSIVLPTNDANMHNNSVATGDEWAEAFLTPLLQSELYRRGDTAIFFVWDEDTAIPNVLIAPSIVPGSRVAAPTGAPISHYSALRTWEEMLGLPLLGDAPKAPSLLAFFNGEAAAREPAGTR
jgi:phospholipase C